MSTTWRNSQIILQDGILCNCHFRLILCIIALWSHCRRMHFHFPKVYPNGVPFIMLQLQFRWNWEKHFSSFTASSTVSPDWIVNEHKQVHTVVFMICKLQRKQWKEMKEDKNYLHIAKKKSILQNNTLKKVCMENSCILFYFILIFII